MSTDQTWAGQIATLAPESWIARQITALEDAGDWNEVLLYRFLVLDADDPVIDGPDVVRVLRSEMMVQIAVLCFGGSKALRDELRLARADRFFDRDAAASVLPSFFGQYNW